jgi:hypothetical protein
MLFDGWGDDDGGVTRLEVLRRTALHGSYHFADRTFTVELALHGPFHIVPEHLYYRRRHPGQGGKRASVRGRCAYMDPRRASRLRNPVIRLYAEYIWGYVSAIQHAPLSARDRLECYQLLPQRPAHGVTGCAALPPAPYCLRRSMSSTMPASVSSRIRRSRTNRDDVKSS